MDVTMAMPFLMTMMFLMNCVTKSHTFQHQHEHKPGCDRDPQNERTVGEAILIHHHMEALRQDHKQSRPQQKTRRHRSKSL